MRQKETFFRYRYYSLFNRNFRTLFLICMAAMLMISIMIGLFFAGALFEELSRQSLNTATILSGNIDRLLQNLDLAGGALVKNDAAVQKLMFDKKYDPASYVEGLTEAWKIQGIYPNILFLACYNPYQDAIFSTITMTEEANEELLSWIRRHPTKAGESTIEIFDIKMQGEQDITTPLPTMVLLKTSEKDEKGNSGIAMVGIDCGVFQSYLTTAAEQSQGVVFMVDEHGRVMSHSDRTQVESDYSSVPFVQDILHRQDDEGIFSTSIDRVRRIVAYSRNGSGWTLISIVPPDSIFSRLFFSKDLVMYFPVIIFFLAALFSIAGAQITFLPIHKLLRPYTKKMSEKGADLSLLISQMTVYREKLDAQITGTAKRWIWRQLPPEEMMTLPELFVDLNAPFYVVGLLRVDRSIKFLLLEDSEQNKVTSALRNECMDALERAGYKSIYIPIKFYRFDVVVPIEREEERANVAEAIQKGLDSFYEKLSQPCCASVSNPVDRIEKIPDATQESLNLLIDRFYASESTPKVYLTQTYKMEQLRYDYQWEIDLWEAIKNNQPSELRAALDRFMERIYRCPYEYGCFYTLQMLLNVTANWMGLRPDEVLLPYYDEIQRITKQDTLDLIHASLWEYLSSLLIQEKRTEATDAGLRIIDSAIRLTKQHFRDPNFSASTVAEMLGISTVYFNRVFKRATGRSYSAYLNSCRLDMVSRLLRTTQEPLSKIHQVVGISNENYCYVLFKKEFGVTPNQYRKHYAMEQKEATEKMSENP